MKTKHTEGPWKVSGFCTWESALSGTVRLPILHNGSIDIAYMAHDTSEQNEEDKANCALLASAPKLLHALELAYLSMCDAYSDFASSPKGLKISQTIKEAKGE